MLYLRSFIFNIVCYSTLTVGCIFNSLVGLVSPKATIKIWNYTFIPFLVWSLKHLAGIEIEIRGRQYMMQEDCIYAGKHESALETYVLSNYINRYHSVKVLSPSENGDIGEFLPLVEMLRE